MSRMRGCDPAVEVSSLRKRYGRREVLQGVSFTVSRGELFCIVGPNGAGKTTLLETILGLREPDGGYVKLLCEHDPRKALTRVGYVLEDMSMVPTLTLRENLTLLAKIRGIDVSEEEVNRVLEALGLEDVEDVLYGKLSAGLKKHGNLAAAMLGSPELSILDEPEANLYPTARLELMQLLVETAKENGVTVVYSTHVLPLASKYAERVLVLDGGRAVAIGDPSELAARYGGSWRIRLALKDERGLELLRRYATPRIEGRWCMVQVRSFDEVMSLMTSLAEEGVKVGGIIIEPPQLEEAFKKLVRGVCGP